jgi:hypothetical protein
LEENIKEDNATKRIDRGKVTKKKRTPMDALEHLAEKKEEQVNKALKMWVMWTWGFGT